MNDSLVSVPNVRTICVQPGCLFKKAGFKVEHLAELTIRLLAGEPLNRIVTDAERIVARPQCIRCALRIMQRRKAYQTKDEWQHLDDLGHWRHRRHRRRRRLEYLAL